MIEQILGKVFKFATATEEIVSQGYDTRHDIESDVGSISMRSVLIGSAVLVVLIIAGMLLKKYKRGQKLMLPIFGMIAFTTVAVSTLLVSLTIYLNVTSDSGGPVHWHADFEVWACNTELELRNPTGLSNKIGTATLHEHDDRRIHLEGVVVDERFDASLGKFMHVIDGGVSKNTLVAPLEPSGYFEDDIDGDGPSDKYAAEVEPYITTAEDKATARFVSGENCGDELSEVQVFVYQYDESDNTYQQTKLEDPANYTISRNPNIPPGDCVIFEFGPPRDFTDKLCEQYGVRDTERCREFGVEADKVKEFCTSEDVTPETQEDI